MDNTTALDKVHLEILGHAMRALVAALYPICRNITGDGLRESLRRLQRFVLVRTQ